MGKLVKNAATLLRGVEGSPKRLERRMVALVHRIIRFAHDEVTQRTPVWSGQALRNYVWSLGAPAQGFKGDPGGVAKGPTNSMPLGPEPRRAAAQAEADASRDALKFRDPYQKVYLTNNTPHIRGLEYGRYPRPPLRQRSPSGMFRVTLKSLAARLRVGAI